MKQPDLITGFFDCCRRYEARGTSKQVSVREPSHGRVQKLMLHACDRNAEAYEVKGQKHGSEFICRSKDMSIDSLKFLLLCYINTPCELRVISSPRKNVNMVCTQSQYIVSGVFTGCLLEHLSTPDLPLFEMVRLVTRAVVALKGELQQSVR